MIVFGIFFFLTQFFIINNEIVEITCYIYFNAILLDTIYYVDAIQSTKVKTNNYIIFRESYTYLGKQ
jgi:hypothetical protein